jgi:tetratricopeptide (TPR) repeat protein
MPRQQASDGGHTVFTDHRIARSPAKDESFDQPASISAWRQPADSSLVRRNLALAFAQVGMERQSSDFMNRGYQMLAYVERDFPNDPAVLSQLGLLALSANQSQQALDLFERAAGMEADSAEAQTNVAVALLRLNRLPEAVEHLEKALALDPLLRSSVNLLARVYQQQGEAAKAAEIVNNYRRAMGVSAALSR